jgi:hypothetical protein
VSLEAAEQRFSCFKYQVGKQPRFSQMGFSSWRSASALAQMWLFFPEVERKD